MFRKISVVLASLACAIVAVDASATQLDTDGTAVVTDPEVWNAPKIAPSTHCQSLMLFLADVPDNAEGLRRYRFTGTCTINTARQGRMPKMKTVEVLVDAEYAPKLHRASERVEVQDPDLGVKLSTWATCPSDPFVGTNVACTNKGMGANKFDKFINVEDAPFARQRANQGQVAVAEQHFAQAKQRGATAASFYQPAQILGFSPIRKSSLGTPAQIVLNVKGGAGMCPGEMDFGDGSPKQSIPVWSGNVGPYQYVVDHAYAKPGFFKVAVRTLPGCEGEHIAYALVVK